MLTVVTRNEKGYWCLMPLSDFVFMHIMTTMCLLSKRVRAGGVDTFVELTSLPLSRCLEIFRFTMLFVFVFGVLVNKFGNYLNNMNVS